MIRYRMNKLDTPVTVTSGDIFRCAITEHNEFPGASQELYSFAEDINETLTISCVAAVYFPGVGFAGFFGNDDLPAKLRELFPGAYEVPKNESLFPVSN